MKRIFAICLLFAGYLCGFTGKAEADTIPSATGFVVLKRTWCNTKPLEVAASGQYVFKTYRVSNHRQFLKRQRKAQRQFTILLQSTIAHTASNRQTAAKAIPPNSHALNRWLPHYLSLFALFKV